MRNLCRIIEPYRCKICGEEMLFFVTSGSYLIDYKKLFYTTHTAYSLYNKLSKNNVCRLRCVVCKRNFMIDWSKMWPEQLVDRSKLNMFKEYPSRQ